VRRGERWTGRKAKDGGVMRALGCREWGEKRWGVRGGEVVREEIGGTRDARGGGGGGGRKEEAEGVGRCGGKKKGG